MNSLTNAVNSKRISLVSRARSLGWTFFALFAMPGILMAQDFGGSETDERIGDFFSNIEGLLNIASIAVVTIAIIFAGYQIAFAHKRIADVAPILIGGLLIGAAAQIARMLLGPDEGGVALLMQAMPMLYA